MNTSKLKVMTILGTRPEIIRLSRILPMMDQYFRHVIVYTQQNYDYELSEIFFHELDIRKPDYLLSVKAPTIGVQIGNILSQTEVVMRKEKPDALLVLGDTNSSLASIVAKRLRIMIFHMEAGNRCFDWDVPEETNRALVDAVSDIHLPYTEHARRYLMTQGIHASKIFVTGSPLREVYEHYQPEIERSGILKKLHLVKEKYFIVSTHREENVDRVSRLKNLFHAFSMLAELYKLPIYVSLHPRTAKMMKDIADVHPLVKFHKPFGYFDYVHLQKDALCVLSDSGSIQEESSIDNFKAVQLRVNLERPEAFDAGSILLTGMHPTAIVHAVGMIIDQSKKGETVPVPTDYLERNVSAKVVKLIMGLAGIRKYDG